MSHSATKKHKHPQHYIFLTALVLIGLYILPEMLVAQSQIGQALNIPAKQIICPNGNIQFTPCTPQQRILPIDRQSLHKAVISRNLATRASILHQVYRDLNNEQGLWEGFVVGQGLLNLSLLIYDSKGKVIETRQIGQIKQDQREKPTKFSFRSAIPSISNWQWGISINKIG